MITETPPDIPTGHPTGHPTDPQEQQMPVRPLPTLLTSALVLTLTALPLAGTASARPASSSSCSAQAIEAAPKTGPDVEALCAALAGLPDQDATAALIRV